MDSPLRVRIHLNLANPELAESVIRVQSHTGAWVSVAYAKELMLENAVPVVDLDAQRKISQGASKKTPHAFVEGDLAHFVGRLREKAPLALLRKVAPQLVNGKGFERHWQTSIEQGQQINYNPRFATCFYLDHPFKGQIQDKLVACQRLAVVGWKFLATGIQSVPMAPGERMAPERLERTSIMERQALARGRKTTEQLTAARNRMRAG